eukprot:COSAG04_NODE_965_length_9140_cov_5.526048_4_plen_64_part_00
MTPTTVAVQFCVVANLLSAQQLDRFRESCSRQLEKILADRGVDGRKYKQETGRLPHRCKSSSA